MSDSNDHGATIASEEEMDFNFEDMGFTVVDDYEDDEESILEHTEFISIDSLNDNDQDTQSGDRHSSRGSHCQSSNSKDVNHSSHSRNDKSRGSRRTPIRSLKQSHSQSKHFRSSHSPKNYPTNDYKSSTKDYKPEGHRSSLRSYGTSFKDNKWSLKDHKSSFKDVRLTDKVRSAKYSGRHSRERRSRERPSNSREKRSRERHSRERSSKSLLHHDHQSKSRHHSKDSKNYSKSKNEDSDEEDMKITVLDISDDTSTKAMDISELVSVDLSDRKKEETDQDNTVSPVKSGTAGVDPNVSKSRGSDKTLKPKANDSGDRKEPIIELLMEDTQSSSDQTAVLNRNVELKLKSITLPEKLSSKYIESNKETEKALSSSKKAQTEKVSTSDEKMIALSKKVSAQEVLTQKTLINNVTMPKSEKSLTRYQENTSQEEELTDLKGSSRTSRDEVEVIEINDENSDSPEILSWIEKPEIIEVSDDDVEEFVLGGSGNEEMDSFVEIKEDYTIIDTTGTICKQKPQVADNAIEITENSKPENEDTICEGILSTIGEKRNLSTENLGTDESVKIIEENSMNHQSSDTSNIADFVNNDTKISEKDVGFGTQATVSILLEDDLDDERNEKNKETKITKKDKACAKENSIFNIDKVCNDIESSNSLSIVQEQQFGVAGIQKNIQINEQEMKKSVYQSNSSVNTTDPPNEHTISFIGVSTDPSWPTIKNVHQHSVDLQKKGVDSNIGIHEKYISNEKENVESKKENDKQRAVSDNKNEYLVKNSTNTNLSSIEGAHHAVTRNVTSSCGKSFLSNRDPKTNVAYAKLLGSHQIPKHQMNPVVVLKKLQMEEKNEGITTVGFEISRRKQLNKQFKKSNKEKVLAEDESNVANVEWCSVASIDVDDEGIQKTDEVEITVTNELDEKVIQKEKTEKVEFVTVSDLDEEEGDIQIQIDDTLEEGRKKEIEDSEMDVMVHIIGNEVDDDCGEIDEDAFKAMMEMQGLVDVDISEATESEGHKKVDTDESKDASSYHLEQKEKKSDEGIVDLSSKSKMLKASCGERDVLNNSGISKHHEDITDSEEEVSELEEFGEDPHIEEDGEEEEDHVTNTLSSTEKNPPYVEGVLFNLGGEELEDVDTLDDDGINFKLREKAEKKKGFKKFSEEWEIPNFTDKPETESLLTALKVPVKLINVKLTWLNKFIKFLDFVGTFSMQSCNGKGVLYLDLTGRDFNPISMVNFLARFVSGNGKRRLKYETSPFLKFLVENRVMQMKRTRQKARKIPLLRAKGIVIKGSIMIYNLTSEVTEVVLKQMFPGCERIIIPNDFKGNQTKIALVIYDTESQVKTVLKSRFQIRKRTVVSYADLCAHTTKEKWVDNFKKEKHCKSVKEKSNESQKQSDEEATLTRDVETHLKLLKEKSSQVVAMASNKDSGTKSDQNKISSMKAANNMPAFKIAKNVSTSKSIEEYEKMRSPLCNLETASKSQTKERTGISRKTGLSASNKVSRFNQTEDYEVDNKEKKIHDKGTTDRKRSRSHEREAEKQKDKEASQQSSREKRSNRIEKTPENIVWGSGARIGPDSGSDRHKKFKLTSSPKRNDKGETWGKRLDNELGNNDHSEPGRCEDHSGPQLIIESVTSVPFDALDSMPLPELPEGVVIPEGGFIVEREISFPQPPPTSTLPAENPFIVNQLNKDYRSSQVPIQSVHTPIMSSDLTAQGIPDATSYMLPGTSVPNNTAVSLPHHISSTLPGQNTAVVQGNPSSFPLSGISVSSAHSHILGTPIVQSPMPIAIPPHCNAGPIAVEIPLVNNAVPAALHQQQVVGSAGQLVHTLNQNNIPTSIVPPQPVVMGTGTVLPVSGARPMVPSLSQAMPVLQAPQTVSLAMQPVVSQAAVRPSQARLTSQYTASQNPSHQIHSLQGVPPPHPIQQRLTLQQQQHLRQVIPVPTSKVSKSNNINITKVTIACTATTTMQAPMSSNVQTSVSTAAHALQVSKLKEIQKVVAGQKQKLKETLANQKSGLHATPDFQSQPVKYTKPTSTSNNITVSTVEVVPLLQTVPGNKNLLSVPIQKNIPSTKPLSEEDKKKAGAQLKQKIDAARWNKEFKEREQRAKAEKERVQQEKFAKEKLLKEKAEKERIQREKQLKEKAEREKKRKEREAKERREKEKMERERKMLDKQEKERREREERIMAQKEREKKRKLEEAKRKDAEGNKLKSGPESKDAKGLSPETLKFLRHQKRKPSSYHRSSSSSDNSNSDSDSYKDLEDSERTLMKSRKMRMMLEKMDFEEEKRKLKREREKLAKQEERLRKLVEASAMVGEEAETENSLITILTNALEAAKKKTTTSGKTKSQGKKKIISDYECSDMSMSDEESNRTPAEMVYDYGHKSMTDKRTSYQPSKPLSQIPDYTGLSRGLSYAHKEESSKTSPESHPDLQRTKPSQQYVGSSQKGTKESWDSHMNYNHGQTYPPVSADQRTKSSESDPLTALLKSSLNAVQEHISEMRQKPIAVPSTAELHDILNKVKQVTGLTPAEDPSTSYSGVQKPVLDTLSSSYSVGKKPESDSASSSYSSVKKPEVIDYCHSRPEWENYKVDIKKQLAENQKYSLDYYMGKPQQLKDIKSGCDKLRSGEQEHWGYTNIQQQTEVHDQFKQSQTVYSYNQWPLSKTVDTSKQGQKRLGVPIIQDDDAKKGKLDNQVETNSKHQKHNLDSDLRKSRDVDFLNSLCTSVTEQYVDYGLEDMSSRAERRQMQTKYPAAQSADTEHQQFKKKDESNTSRTVVRNEFSLLRKKQESNVSVTNTLNINTTTTNSFYIKNSRPVEKLNYSYCSSTDNSTQPVQKAFPQPQAKPYQPPQVPFHSQGTQKQDPLQPTSQGQGSRPGQNTFDWFKASPTPQIQQTSGQSKPLKSILKSSRKQPTQAPNAWPGEKQDVSVVQPGKWGQSPLKFDYLHTSGDNLVQYEDSD